jgi:hypothetical protein
MDQAIESIYAELLYNRREHDPGYERIHQSIVGAAQREGVSLRPDAVYFLANNISEMILEPTHLARVRGVSLDTGPVAAEAELYSALDSDLDLIIRSASAEAAVRGRERSPISAASVIFGLGHVLDALRINNWRLWG